MFCSSPVLLNLTVIKCRLGLIEWLLWPSFAQPVLFVLNFVYWNVFYCCVLRAQTWLDLTWLDILLHNSDWMCFVLKEIVVCSCNMIVWFFCKIYNFVRQQYGNCKKCDINKICVLRWQWLVISTWHHIPTSHIANRAVRNTALLHNTPLRGALGVDHVLAKYVSIWFGNTSCE